MTSDEKAQEQAIWEGIQSRLEVIIDALEVPERVVADDDPKVRFFKLIQFAKRHGQSLDWIVMGDVRCMLIALAGRERTA